MWGKHPVFCFRDVGTQTNVFPVATLALNLRCIARRDVPGRGSPLPAYEFHTFSVFLDTLLISADILSLG